MAHSRQLAEAAARLAQRERRAALGVVVLTLLFVLAGGLSPWLAIAGCAALAAVALAREIAAGTSDAQRAPGGTQGRRPLEGLWQETLDALPDPVLTLDGGGRLLHINRAAADIYPMLRKGGHYSLISRDPAFLEAVESTEARSVELHHRVPIERRLLAHIAALSPASEDRESPRIIISMRDLSEQDRLTRMRADFVANASHELRTPLAALSGFVETLQGRAKDDPAARARFLTIMSEQATRMTHLVDDLLSLSRVEIREHVPPQAVIDVDEPIDAAMLTVEPLAQKAEVTLTRTGADGPLMVRGDRDELVQVIQNLVQNAIKYGRRGGHVEIDVAREITDGQRRLAITVRDDGPGIAPDHLPRLTERFYRVNAAASREKGGTGLGLAIVKHIVNRHRGALRIASELGRGSSFTVVLDEQPATDAAPGPSHARQGADI